MARSAIAIVAHPDDIEFLFAGTLLQPGRVGYELHYLCLANGCCGSQTMGSKETANVRRFEAKQAAGILGARWHPPLCNDLEILYSLDLLRRLAVIIREARPEIVLTHSPQDYMVDHEETARLAVTAAFTHGMPNFGTDPPSQASITIQDSERITATRSRRSTSGPITRNATCAATCRSWAGMHWGSSAPTRSTNLSAPAPPCLSVRRTDRESYHLC